MKFYRLLTPAVTAFIFFAFSPSASAGFKRSIARRAFGSGSSGRSGSGGYGGSVGSMSAETLVTGVAFTGALFCAACAVVFFLHTWLLTSLVAAKILTVLGFFSFLAGPLFILALLPLAVFLFFAVIPFSQSVGPDLYGALYMVFFLVFALFLYFYLMNVLLAALAKKSWGKRITQATALVGFACGLWSVISQGSITALILPLLAVFCAWAAWKTHEKIAARALAKKAAKERENTIA